ncbi:alpha/beta hydrolase [Labrys neptuniae]|uniref:alpha/beta fold hydrolase n=1 Tax=Labrys neptuniae TaxID=376174 RepID=UPI00288D9EA0|nr:alpha/beta hydrolase [Labrys neptuniae]MDT3382438.1 alpha/beta hydrolase [Labrys neptuniae]
MTNTLETAVTQYVKAGDIDFAYRRMGKSEGTPLVLLQHFTGTMDAWDPSVVNALAVERPVIVFNNAGVGSSSGSVPDNVQKMSTDAEDFILALNLGEVDLLGFSLGGFIAQVIATQDRVKVRKLIVAGSAPKGGEEHLLQVVGEAFAKKTRDVRLPLFFTLSEASQQAGAAFVDRTLKRMESRDPDSGQNVSNPQAAAIMGWCAEQDANYELLQAIKQPALIVHGSDDTMFPSINAYEMFKHMSNATLIIYPDSGHGAIFQHVDAFVAHVRIFLTA